MLLLKFLKTLKKINRESYKKKSRQNSRDNDYLSYKITDWEKLAFH